MGKVRVRFAPSPTGFLHVGGARTALFNWLFARRQGGEFLLRIEDTDRARSSEAMVAEILEGLRWLGIDWDEGPFFQSGRVEAHRADAFRLERDGRAYPCFCPPGGLEERRRQAEREGRPWKYDRRCLDLPPAEVARRKDAGEPFCLRFLVPEGGTEVRDLVHGETAFENASVEDFVLLRSDATPTYQMSVVSDDIAMRVDHVVRGDDHLSNTPKQILLYRALGACEPAFAHLPLIHGGDGSRLSKRHGAVAVTDYRKDGYLPEAMVNFLALLGWSPGTDQEILRREELVASFSFERVSPKSAIFDLRKLEWMNSQYLSRASPERLAPLVREALEGEGLWQDDLLDGRRAWFLRLIEILRERCRRIGDFARDGRPFLTDNFNYDEEAARKNLGAQGLADRMRALRERIAPVSPFDEPSVEAALRGLAEELGTPAGHLIHPLRVALTGRAVGPGIFITAVLVGKDRVLRRIDRLIDFLKSRGIAPPA